MISIDFEWSKEGKRYIENMPNVLRESLIEGIRNAMFYAEGEAKKGFGSGKGPPNPPPGPLIARTGHLRRSIEGGVEEVGSTGYIKTDVKYGRPHELGNAKMPARPFLMPAIENNLDKIQNIIANNIVKGLK